MSLRLEPFHISRGWPGMQDVEDECPCPQEPCGYVNEVKVVASCDQHPFIHAQTIRSSHCAQDCPGERGTR